MWYPRKLKAEFSKLKFNLGLSPIIDKRGNLREFIPEPYKTVVLISADFELAWAWQWAKVENPLSFALQKATLCRHNFPKILLLCDRFNIPVTWATVGHLFLKSCNGHPKHPVLEHFENDFWKFNRKDWFENDPKTDSNQDPLWYAPDLIENLLNSKVKHEIGCHTFSHIDCRDEVCSSEVFNAEINECKKEASKYKLKLKSFVHPAHTIGNLDNLARQGFTNYRTNYRNVLTYPRKHNNGLWEFEQTAEFVYRKEWSVEYHVKRYITLLERAIKTKTVAVLWFHPSFPSVVVDKILPDVFQFLYNNRDEVWTTTHSDYVNWLNSNDK